MRHLLAPAAAGAAGACVGAGAGAGGDAFTIRHNGKGNAGFADGHVSPVLPAFGNNITNCQANL